MNSRHIFITFIISTIVFLCSGCSDITDGSLGNNEEQLYNELKDKYFEIAKEYLNGWENGYTDGKNHIVGTHISDSDSTVFMICSEENPNSVCYFLFDEEKSLIGFGTEENWISTFEDDNMVYLGWFNSNNTMCGDCFKQNVQNKSSTLTKSISTEALFDYEKISKITGAIGYIQSANNINQDIIEKEYILLAKDITILTASIVLDILKVSGKVNLAVFIAEVWIEGFVSTHNQRFQMAMYNECKTEITNISSDGAGNINVFVTIKNPDSVPAELVRLYYPTDEDIINNVYCGIVGRKGVYPTSRVFTEPYKEEHLLDRSWGKERYLMYTFPMPKANERHVFKSYLKSTRIVNKSGEVNNGYIKYSEPYYFNNIGLIDRFSQESYSELADVYIFNCTAHASIEALEKVSQWGLYYDDGGFFSYKFFPKEYSEPSLSSPSSAEFEMEIKIKKQDFGNDTYKDIKLGIFTYDSVHDKTTWGTTQIFSVSIDNRWVDLGLPSGILWAKYNVGASSPEEYGDYYAWGETETKSSYGMSNYNLYDLNIDISNTNYDVATQKWGNGARIPSLENFKELLSNCSWYDSSYNGIRGYYAKGSNGNKIFFPFSGYKMNSLTIHRNYAGCFWSSTPSGDLAYILECFSEEGLDDKDYIYCYVDKDYGMTVRPVKDKN